MLVFTIIFSRIAKPSDGDAPYALMVFAGILPWTLFATGLSEASNSLINNSNLISKVYFPRLIVPTATVVVAFVDFLISFCILGALMGWYRFWPDWRIVVLPFFILLASLVSIGPALWISSLNVSIAIFAISYHLSSNSACMCHLWDSAQAWSRRNGVSVLA